MVGTPPDVNGIARLVSNPTGDVLERNVWALGSLFKYINTTGLRVCLAASTGNSINYWSGKKKKKQRKKGKHRSIM